MRRVHSLLSTITIIIFNEGNSSFLAYYFINETTKQRSKQAKTKTGRLRHSFRNSFGSMRQPVRATEHRHFYLPFVIDRTVLLKQRIETKMLLLCGDVQCIATEARKMHRYSFAISRCVEQKKICNKMRNQKTIIFRSGSLCRTRVKRRYASEKRCIQRFT